MEPLSLVRMFIYVYRSCFSNHQVLTMDKLDHELRRTIRKIWPTQAKKQLPLLVPYKSGRSISCMPRDISYIFVSSSWLRVCYVWPCLTLSKLVKIMFSKYAEYSMYIPRLPVASKLFRFKQRSSLKLWSRRPIHASIQLISAVSSRVEYV